MMKATPQVPIQADIERAMHEFGLTEKRWEYIVLFSGDGLVMASSGESPLYPSDMLLEFSFSLLETVKLLNTATPFPEIIIAAAGHKTLVFRYFEAWDEPMILAAVVSGRKGFKRALTRLIKRIASID